MPLTKITGGEFDNTQGGLSVAGIMTSGGARIGSTSPAAQYSTLSVIGDAAIIASGPTLSLVGTDGLTRYGYLYHGGAGSDLYLTNQQNGNLLFSTNNTERARLDSSGRLGIGTNNPQRSLHIYGNYSEFLIEDPLNSVNSNRLNIFLANDKAQFRMLNQTGTGGTTFLQGDAIGNITLPTANTSILNSSGRKILNQTGGILQVVQTVKSDVFGTSSTSYIDVTGFNATITPSSTSSRILIFVTGSAGVSGAVTGGIQLLRGSTAICVGNTLAGYTSSSGPNFYSGSSDGNNNEAFAIHYLDSPATTSATTYKLQVYAPQGGNLYVNTLGSFISGQVYSMVTASTITLMEVSG